MYSDVYNSNITSKQNTIKTESYIQIRTPVISAKMLSYPITDVVSILSDKLNFLVKNFSLKKAQKMSIQQYIQFLL